jgi:hypothetical protein
MTSNRMVSGEIRQNLVSRNRNNKPHKIFDQR